MAGLQTVGDVYEALGWRSPETPLQIQIEGDDRVFIVDHLDWDYNQSGDILVVREKKGFKNV